MKNNRLNIFFPVLALIFFRISFFPVFLKLAARWDSGDNSYCYLIIPIFIYLCWDKKDKFKFMEFSWNLWGFAPVIFFLLLMIAGELGSVETFLYAGIWGCVAGMGLILYSWRIRHLFFPLIILAFMVPIPPFVNRLLTFQLKLAASSISVIMLRLSRVSVLQEGNIIDLGTQQLQVVDACSGLRYMVPMVLLSLLIGYFSTRGWWRRAVLLAVVPPLSVFVNSFRIYLTGMLTVHGHPELAQNFFHDFSGWLVFMVASGLLLIAAFILRKTGHVSVKKISDSGGRTSGQALPVLISILLCIFFAGSGIALQKLPAAKNLPDRKSLSDFPMQIAEWQGRQNYLSDEIMKSLWADDYVSAMYIRQDSVNRINLLIPFYEYQGTRHTAHAPQSCMLGSGWAMVDSAEKPIHLKGGKKIKTMTIIWEKDGARMLAGYFFFQRGRVITSPWMNKFYLMWDAFTKRRTDGALVRVEMVVPRGQSMKDANAVLEDFISLIFEKLPLYVPL